MCTDLFVFYINFDHTGLKRLSTFSQSLIICPQIGTYLHYLLRLDPQISLICILLKYYYFFLPRSNIRTRNKFLKCSQQRNAKTQNLANSCRSLFSKVELSSLKVFITGHKEPHNNKWTVRECFIITFQFSFGLRCVCFDCEVPLHGKLKPIHVYMGLTSRGGRNNSNIDSINANPGVWLDRYSAIVSIFCCYPLSSVCSPLTR